MAAKRTRLSPSTEEEQAKIKHAAAAADLGRVVRVFTSSTVHLASEKVSASFVDEADDFYDLTPEDYYEIMSRKTAGHQIFKTLETKEAEVAACRARIPKVVIRTCFPDGFILEAEFQSSEKLQCLVDLLLKVVARPDLPFYLYTSPPKMRMEDTSKDFYSAGFAPGATVYFSYDMPKGFDSADTSSWPFLCDNILSLNGLNIVSKKADVVLSEPAPVMVKDTHPVPQPMPVAKKSTKPKWFKM